MEATMTTINILDYSPELKEHFKNLNMEWLKQFKNTKARLIEVENPQEHIIEKGGFVYFAEIKNSIVGAIALLRESHKLYEIADMAVTASQQGKHIGKALLQKTIDTAKQLGAKQVYLVASTKLKASLEMYRAFGFREMPYDPEMSLFDGTDVKMVLNLK
jgi:N-acetylglutamate synthase-like GNAT family acetyltransferase